MSYNYYQTLDKWRTFFKTSNEDIFDVIHNAILVAAKDYPKGFRSKRDKIAEALFSCTSAESTGSDHVELSGGYEEGCKGGVERQNNVFEKGVSKDISKVMISSGDHDQVIVSGKQDSNHNVEALSDELEEEHQVINEVLKIKMILQSANEESESVLLDSLRQLQLMDLSVDKLDATKIGKTVNLLRKHRSKNIGLLAKKIITSWKDMVNDQLSVNKQAIAEAADTPQSVKPPGTEEEGGLPSPPLDEAAFFFIHPDNLDLEKLFDGLDANGNLYQSEELKENLENAPSKNKRSDDSKKPEPKMRKHAKVVVDKKASNGTKKQQKTGKRSIRKRRLAYAKDELKSMDLIKEKLATKREATKRKLHEGYQQHQNAKKRRTIQVMDLSDIPKQRLGKSERENQSRPFGLC